MIIELLKILASLNILHIQIIYFKVSDYFKVLSESVVSVYYGFFAANLPLINEIFM